MNAVHCMRRWFLSYNSSDSGNAERLEAALKVKDAAAQVFFAPKNLRAGGYWQPVLAQEIANATAFLLIVGEATALFARGLAKLKNGDAVGGDADVAAAKAIKPGISDEFELN